MVFVCTFPVETPDIESFFQPLGVFEGRYYYISKNYLEEFFKIHKEAESLPIFMEELKIGGVRLPDILATWLNIDSNAILHLTVDEMGTFVELVHVSDSEDLYLNLMESKDGDVSLGQHIFINSLTEIVRRFRNG